MSGADSVSSTDRTPTLGGLTAEEMREVARGMWRAAKFFPDSKRGFMRLCAEASGLAEAIDKGELCDG